VYWPLLERELQPLPGVGAVLDSLSCKICVASSGRPARLEYALSLVGLYDRFRPHVFSATEVPRGKPAPDLFLHAAARMGVMPARCVVIEDSVPGVMGAVAAGMSVIGFVGASHCRSDDAARLAAHGAALVINDMAKLLSALA
jgi:HAD superfamily hydrolase (TIGR01509 family)